MTIDEAMAHAREAVNSNKTKAAYDDEFLKRFCTSKESCIKCAEEHEQLAEWLEELKAIKSNGRYVQGNKAGQKIGYKDGYGKAIDDFANGIKEILEDNAIYNMDCIYTLAEQLKAGGRE